ncbi:MAG: carboxylating nicotinate-nucleotide diphosphorylase [Cytophagaceae bacterium]|nr:carboxylating nicotinate-nucleotide diphosphorylase [Cytophagaceae bacterium]
MNYLTDKAIDAFIESALQEDVGDGDHSSLSSIPAPANGKARLIIKDDGIIAGVELSQKIFSKVDHRLRADIFIKDGSPIKKGDIALEVSGSVHTILKAERLVLNCMQRMSGIATLTHELNELIKDTGAKLLDTRKTTPNFRMLEKWAVAIGGGVNHRYGLFDMIILKDNHVDYAGGIKKAISAAKEYLKKTEKNLPIEIETRNLEEVSQVMEEGGVKRIMLDNMSPGMMKEAVKIIGGKYETEASGGITKHNIREVALTGVDYISVGALTHSIKSLDMSLKAVK